MENKEKAFVCISEAENDQITIEAHGNGGQLMQILVSTFLEDKDLFDLFQMAVMHASMIRKEQNPNEVSMADALNAVMGVKGEA